MSNQEHLGLDALLALREEYAECERCPLLCKSRSAPVFGSGSATAPIPILGDCPGDEEDEAGIPFAGVAGRRMLDMLRMAWPETEELAALEGVWDRYGDSDRYWDALRDYLDQYIFWTNLILCKPTDSDGDRRAPAPNEIKSCKDRLHRTIYAVDPILIIALGKAPASALTGKVVQIVKQRGEVFDVKVQSPVTGEQVRYPCLATLSPGHLLSTGSAGLLALKQGDTYETIQDLKWAITTLLAPQYRDTYGVDFPERPDKN